MLWPGLGLSCPGEEKGGQQVYTQSGLQLLSRAHVLGAAPGSLVPAESIHPAIEACGGCFLGCGSSLLQGFPGRLFSFPLVWLGRKGKKKIQVT